MNSSANLVVLAVAVLVVLVAGWLIYRRRAAGGRLQRTLDAISFDRIEGLVLPNADEGEIQIDHLLLTSRGLLVVHIKDVEGTVFGSDKMQNWTVMSTGRRYTFSNPQPALFDRIAAVRQVIKDVPVEGRLLFPDDAEFSKGTPQMVSSIDELQRDFLDDDAEAARRKVDSFKPYWETIQKRAG